MKKKKADNLPIANSFLISKLKRIQKNWKPSLQVMANICQSKQISKAFCTCNKSHAEWNILPVRDPSTCKNARWEINKRSMSNSVSIEINLENPRLILDNLIFLIKFSRVNLTISMLKSLTTLCFTVLLQTIYGTHHMQQCMLCLFFLRYRNKIATFKLINSISIYFN